MVQSDNFRGLIVLLRREKAADLHRRDVEGSLSRDKLFAIRAVHFSANPKKADSFDRFISTRRYWGRSYYLRCRYGARLRSFD